MSEAKIQKNSFIHQYTRRNFAGQPGYDPRGHVQYPAVCPKSLHLQQRPVVPVSCRFMKTLKESVHTLVLTAEKGKQAEILRQINRMFLLDLQKNRFGKLYFHRAGRSGNTAFLYETGRR